jgi:hypothetical protein
MMTVHIISGIVIGALVIALGACRWRENRTLQRQAVIAASEDYSQSGECKARLAQRLTACANDPFFE